MIRTTLAKVLTTKVAVAAAATAAVTVGGVATVAATGHLPGSSSGHSAQTSVAASASSTTESKSAPSHSASAGNSTDPSGKPSPSLVGLCHAYTAGAGSEHGKALESPAFTVLITTAGGKDKVDAYCAKLLADEAATPTTDAAKDHSNDAHPDSHDNRVTPTRPSH